MNRIKCPIKGCRGFETTSGRPNIKRHISQKASAELFWNFINDVDNKTPHANYAKENMTVIKTQSIQLVMK